MFKIMAGKNPQTSGVDSVVSPAPPVEEEEDTQEPVKKRLRKKPRTSRKFVEWQKDHADWRPHTTNRVPAKLAKDEDNQHLYLEPLGKVSGELGRKRKLVDDEDENEEESEWDDAPQPESKSRGSTLSRQVRTLTELNAVLRQDNNQQRYQLNQAKEEVKHLKKLRDAIWVDMGQNKAKAYSLEQYNRALQTENTQLLARVRELESLLAVHNAQYKPPLTQGDADIGYEPVPLSPPVVDETTQNEYDSKRVVPRSPPVIASHEVLNPDDAFQLDSPSPLDMSSHSSPSTSSGPDSPPVADPFAVMAAMPMTPLATDADLDRPMTILGSARLGPCGPIP